MALIIPAHAAFGASALDTPALVSALASTDADLWALSLPGESPAELAARRDARNDILDELLAEFAPVVAEGVAA